MHDPWQKLLVLGTQWWWHEVHEDASLGIFAGHHRTAVASLARGPHYFGEKNFELNSSRLPPKKNDKIERHHIMATGHAVCPGTRNNTQRGARESLTASLYMSATLYT